MRGNATDAGQNAILLGQNRARRALVGIDAGVAGRIPRGPVFEQRVLQDRGNAPAVPIHRSVASGQSLSVASTLSRALAAKSGSLGPLVLSRIMNSNSQSIHLSADPCSPIRMPGFHQTRSRTCFRKPSTTSPEPSPETVSLPNCVCPLAISFSIFSSSFFSRSHSAATSIFFS